RRSTNCLRRRRHRYISASRHHHRTHHRRHGRNPRRPQCRRDHRRLRRFCPEVRDAQGSLRRGGIDHMMRRLIDLFLDRPWLVLAACALLIIPGVNSLLNIPIDAFPDLTNNQVSVVAAAPGMAAVEVEQLVTFPIESAMMGIPNTQEVRSISKLGLALVTVIFDDHVPPLQARQLVNERMLDARSSLPAGVMPQMGLLATPFGEAFQYILDGGA